MKTNDLKRQLAAVMALALTFSSVPVVSADDSLSFLPADDSMVVPTEFTAIDDIYTEYEDADASTPEITASGATITDGVITVDDENEGFSLSCAGAAWTSSNTSVATVDENGEVTIVAPGTTTITAIVGEDSATIDIVVLDKVGYTVSRADGKDEALVVEFGADENITAPNIIDKLDGLLKVTLSANSSVYSLTSEDYNYVATHDSDNDGDDYECYNVTIALTDAGEKKFFIDEDSVTACAVNVKKADTTISKADFTLTNVPVTVNNVETVTNKETAAKTAIETAVKKQIKEKYGIEDGYTVTVTEKEADDDTADTTFDVTVAITDLKNFNVEGDGKTTATVVYSNDTVKIVPQYTRDARLGTDETTGNDTYEYTASQSNTPEGNMKAAAEEIKELYSFDYKNKSDNSDISEVVKDKTGVQVTTVKYDEDSATFTVTPIVLSSETANYEIVDSQTYTVVVTFNYVRDEINPTFTYKQGDEDVGKKISVDTAASTVADKEQAAINTILAALDYDALAGSAVKDDDYTVKVEAVGDAGTSARESFKVTFTLVNTDSYVLAEDAETTDTVTVEYVNTATQTRTTISPVISYDEDGYEIEVPASATVSAKKKLAKAELAESVKLTGVDSLTEGVDYKFEIASNAAGTEFTATFTLLTTAKYKIDSACNPTASEGSSVNDTVSATIKVSYKLVKDEITPVLAAAKDTIVKYINGNESYTTVTDALIKDVVANADSAYYTLTGADALVKGTDYDISVENKGTANKPVINVKFTLKSTDTYTVTDAAVTEISIPVEYKIQTVVAPAFCHWDSAANSGNGANVADPVVIKTSPSVKKDAEKLKAKVVKDVTAALIDQLPDGMVEGTDYTLEFADLGDPTDAGFWKDASSQFGESDSSYKSTKITMKLLDDEKYVFSGSVLENKSNDTNDNGYVDVNWINVVVMIEEADAIAIAPVVTAPKSLTVEVYADDDLATRFEKAKNAAAESAKVVIYSGNGDITDTLTRGWDKDYAINTWGAYNSNTEENYDENDAMPVITVAFELVNDSDYSITEGSVTYNDGDNSVTKTPVTSANVTVTYKEVEKPDVETDKWVQSEDGTWSYTASKASSEADPITEPNLILDLGEDVDLEKVTNISATISMTGEGAYAGGTLGATQLPEKWITSDWSNEDMTDGKMTVSLDVDGGVTADSAQLQLWWIGKDTTITLDKVEVEVETEQSEKAESPEITKVITDREANTIGLNWEKVDGAVGYRVYAKTTGTGWTRLASTSGEDATGKWLRGLDPTKKYCFIVKAYVNGEWTDYDAAKTKVASPCSAKPIITKADAQTGKIALNWTSTVNASGYGIYVKAEGGKWTRYAMTTGINSIGKWVKLDAGKKYTIAVKAYVDGKWTDVTSEDMVTVTAK